MEKNRILIQLVQSPQSQHGRVAYDKQSKPQQVFSAVWGLESEVNNGGFAQWFENSAGEMAVETEAALRAIGAPRTGAIVAKAVAVFPGGAPPRDHAARQRLLRTASDEVRSTWECLDQEFFNYPDDLTSLLYAVRHTQRNSAAFSDMAAQQAAAADERRGEAEARSDDGGRRWR